MSEQEIRNVLALPFFKVAEVARRLWPHKTTNAATAHFSDKLNPNVTNRHFSESEWQRIGEILQAMKQEFTACFGSAAQMDGGAKNPVEIPEPVKIDPNIFAPKKRAAGLDD